MRPMPSSVVLMGSGTVPHSASRTGIHLRRTFRNEILRNGMAACSAANAWFRADRSTCKVVERSPAPQLVGAVMLLADCGFYSWACGTPPPRDAHLL